MRCSVPETLDAHRQEVLEAILRATSTLVERQGLRSLTMSKIAEDAGVSRATLYRYFSDVEAILVVWHDAQITAHLEELTAVRDRAEPGERLAAVLGRTQCCRAGHTDTTTPISRPCCIVTTVSSTLATGCGAWSASSSATTPTGSVRRDVPPNELAAYCLHAVRAAAELTSEAAVRRLVDVTLAGLAGVGSHGNERAEARGVTRPDRS